MPIFSDPLNISGNKISEIDKDHEFSSSLSENGNNNSHQAFDDNMEDENVLHIVKNKNPNRLIIEQININSVRNKFEMLKELVKENIDVLLISETKIDKSFSTAEFEIDNFNSPFRLDRNKYGGGLLLILGKGSRQNC